MTGAAELLGWMFLTIGAMSLIPVVIIDEPERRKRKALRERGVATTARVVKSLRRFPWLWQHLTTVQWVDPEGTTRGHSQITRGIRVGEGDEVDAIYDPQKLSTIQVFDERGPRFSGPRSEWVFAVFAVVSISLGLVFLAADALGLLDDFNRWVDDMPPPFSESPVE